MAAKTAQQLIDRALRISGALGSGLNPTPDESNDALDSLNGFLDNLAEQNITVPYRTEDIVQLIQGKFEYTWGIGGEINTERPLAIQESWLTDLNDNSYPFEIIDSKEYSNIGLKSTKSQRPQRAWYEPIYPLARLTMESSPERPYTLHIWTIKPFTGFATLATVSDLPPAYERMIVYNLAVELGPEYDAPIRQDVFQTANIALKNIKSANLSRRVPNLVYDDALVVSNNNRFDIRRGW